MSDERILAGGDFVEEIHSIVENNHCTTSRQSLDEIIEEVSRKSKVGKKDFYVAYECNGNRNYERKQYLHRV